MVGASAHVASTGVHAPCIRLSLCARLERADVGEGAPCVGLARTRQGQSYFVAVFVRRGRPRSKRRCRRRLRAPLLSASRGDARGAIEHGRWASWEAQTGGAAQYSSIAAATAASVDSVGCPGAQRGRRECRRRCLARKYSSSYEGMGLQSLSRQAGPQVRRGGSFHNTRSLCIALAGCLRRAPSSAPGPDGGL